MNLRANWWKDLLPITARATLARWASGDVLIGAAQTIAEYNGIQKASHVKDKIIEMNHLKETL